MTKRVPFTSWVLFSFSLVFMPMMEAGCNSPGQSSTSLSSASPSSSSTQLTSGSRLSRAAASFSAATVPWANRADYHQALEPIGNRILVDVGQDNGGDGLSPYTSFASAVGANPAVWMYYETMGASPSQMMRNAQNLNAALNQVSSDTIMLQIGLDMQNGFGAAPIDAGIAAGNYDANIQGFCAALQYLNRPVYIRLGYEFNGPWNGYQPATYAAAFQRMSSMLRNCGSPVAFVWDMSAATEGGADPDYMAYYPGDQSVDWWAINLLEFAGDDFDFNNPTGLQFLTDADSHGKPVMTGETTSLGVGASQGSVSWNTYFQPYFNFIYSHPGIKMFTYLNDDFTNVSGLEPWGNCIIPANSVVSQNYSSELQNPQYILRMSGNSILNTIYSGSSSGSQPAPTATPTPTSTSVAANFFLTPDGTIYYTSGNGQVCGFSSWSTYLAYGGSPSLQGVVSVSALPAGLLNTGACGSAPVANPTPAPTSTPAPMPTPPAVPASFFITPDGTIYYTSGNGQACGFATWSTYLAYGGSPSLQGVVSVSAFPSGLVNAGVCN